MTRRLQSKRETIRRILILATVCWTALVLISLLWNWQWQNHDVRDLATEQARASFYKDIIYRMWNANRGGVYVEINEDNLPNPYLTDLAQRDLTTTNGIHLTLINPAFMTRQAYEIGAEKYGLREHITSLNPIRPENAPDPWEIQALESFNEGTEEAVSMITIDGRPHLRLMRPLRTDQACLKCHAGQGYKLGDIRGGISVTVAMDPFQEAVSTDLRLLLVGHLIIWLLGLIAIFSIQTRTHRKSLIERVKIEQMISEISTYFVRLSLGRTDSGVSRALASIGNYSGAERVTVFRLRENTSLYGITHEWHVKNATLPENLYENLSADDYPWWISKLRRFEIIHLTSPDELPPEASAEKNLLKAADVRSLLVVPLILQNRLTGFLSAATTQTNHNWRQEDILLMQLAGETIAHALERDQTEKALARQTERLNRIVEGTNVGTWEWNVQSGKIVFNERWAEIQGFKLEEISPTTIDAWRTTCHPDDWKRAEKTLQECFDKKQEFFHCEARVQHKDGSWIWVSDSGKVVTWTQDGKPEWMYGTRTDISREKQQQQLQLKMNQQLQQAHHMESLGVMAGGIAHDFNNILMAIMGQADLALLTMPPGTETREDLESIIESARKAASLCEQMLIYAGRGGVEKQSISISDMIEEIYDMLKVSIPRKEALRLNLTHNLPPVLADRTQITQVLINLIQNASEAQELDSGCITISSGIVECSEEPACDDCVINRKVPGTYVYFAVSDDGPGISKDNLARIFEPFFSTKFTGRGLGLPTALGIVKEHRGTICAQSTPEKGTTFRVLLPAIEPTETKPSPVTPPADRNKTGTVLLVDDEDSIRKITGKMLQKFGLTVLTAPDGPEAIDLYQEQQETIDVVILDLTMPRMNGDKVLEKLRAINPEVQAIIASGYNDENISAIVDGNDHTAYLQKPYTLDNLRAVLSTLIPLKDK